MLIGAGIDISIGKYLSIGAVGNAGGGVGYPALLEGYLEAGGELLFAGKTFGVGVYKGFYKGFLDFSERDSERINYTSFSLIIKNISAYVSFYENETYGIGLRYTPRF